MKRISIKNLKVIKVDSYAITFEGNIKLYSNHNQECYENHYLCFDDLIIEDFEGLRFDLSGEDFVEFISGYGIALKPIKGHPIRIPGYGENSGNYSDNLELVITNNEGFIRIYDITDCQDYLYT